MQGQFRGRETALLQFADRNRSFAEFYRASNVKLATIAYVR
jgi:hypothetical protein